MKKPTLVVGAGALTLLGLALGLALRPGNDPVAAQQPAPTLLQQQVASTPCLLYTSPSPRDS